MTGYLVVMACLLVGAIFTGFGVAAAIIALR